MNLMIIPTLKNNNEYNQNLVWATCKACKARCKQLFYLSTAYI